MTLAIFPLNAGWQSARAEADLQQILNENIEGEKGRSLSFTSADPFNICTDRYRKGTVSAFFFSFLYLLKIPHKKAAYVCRDGSSWTKHKLSVLNERLCGIILFKNNYFNNLKLTIYILCREYRRRYCWKFLKLLCNDSWKTVTVPVAPISMFSKARKKW